MNPSPVVIPAKAGVNCGAEGVSRSSGPARAANALSISEGPQQPREPKKLDPRFRGDDKKRVLRTPIRSVKTPMAKILVAIAVGIVFIVLCLGLYTLWRGGDTARSWSNKLMRIRVLAQFIAIIIIMAVLYFSQHN